MGSWKGRVSDMRISIVRDTELTQEEWVFNSGPEYTDKELCFSLGSYEIWTRPSKRHRIDGPQSVQKRYSPRPARYHNYILIDFEDVPCPDDVIEEAKSRIIGMIHVEKGDKPK